ncbi:MAG: malate dehydrogenase [Thermoanaerobaculia bacterium]
MRKKITVIGAGHVGEVCAQRIAEMELGDVVLLDIIEGMPQGKGLDIYQSGPVVGFDSKVKGTNSYEDTANSDIIVITAGLPRKPGMSRDDLLKANEEIVSQCARESGKFSKDGIMIIVSNPLDAMCEVARRVTGFPKERVFGMAGILDTARMRTFLSMELNISVESITALVLGGHGDTMVPLVRYCTVQGIPISEFLPKDKIEAIVERTRKGGGEIVALLKTGSAYYAPSAAVAEMVEAIVKDKKKLLPCAVYVEGEYGFKGIYLGLPAIIGAKGVEKIVELKLNKEEKEALKKSADAVKELIDLLKV